MSLVETVKGAVAVAFDALDDFVQPLTIEIYNQSQSLYNPTTDVVLEQPTIVTGRGVLVRYSDREMRQHDQIQSNDRKIIMTDVALDAPYPGTIPPTLPGPGDVVVAANGDRFHVLGSSIDPSKTVLIIQGRPVG